MSTSTCPAPDRCRHCGQSGLRRRGLCRCCYFQIDIRDLYPSLSPRGKRMGPDTFDDPARAPRPTEYAPGTSGKIEELRQRLERHEQLWSRADEPSYRETAGSAWSGQAARPEPARSWALDPSGQLWLIEDVPPWWARAGRQLLRFLRGLFGLAARLLRRRRRREAALLPNLFS